MATRAKFKVQRFESTLTMVRGEDGVHRDKELRTIIMFPVFSSEEGSENKKFWDASPSGEIKLGVINQEAWKEFELGAEYYVDFTKA